MKLPRKISVPHIPTIHLPSGHSLARVGFLTSVGIIVLVVALWKEQVSQFEVERTILEIQYEELRNEDQIAANRKLSLEIKNIQTTFTQAVQSYENLVKLREKTTSTAKYDELFTKALVLLSNRNWTTASATLATLNQGIQDEQAKIAAAQAAITPPANVPVSSSPPGSGYSRQTVQSDAGSFVVDIVAGDLGSTRVIVDTASDGTCTNNCPALPLATYVGRSGAYAGVNGSYFCPADYPSCAGKTNSFDTLLMNKNKVYFNSDNNVYSTVPAVIFGGGWIRFVGRSLDWGRDTGIDSMIAMQPLLVSGGNIAFGGNADPKEGAKGSRSFVANRGNTVYIGVVHNVTVAESARVMKAMGMDNALNLDNGGSTALWANGGYRVGPGRNLPNVVLFVRK